MSGGRAGAGATALECLQLAAHFLTRFLDHPIAMYRGLRHACAAIADGHRLVTSDGLSRRARRSDGGGGRFRHWNPAAKLRTIDKGGLRAGHRRDEERTRRNSEKSEAFHDDPAFLNGCFTTNRAHARPESVSGRVLHAQDEWRCW